MLVRLRVKDFALIHQIELELDQHFNVLTGETGAGKSIIIDAVSLLLGARANSKDIRIGCDKAIVEGTFAVEPVDEIDAQLAEYGYALDEERELILYREMSSNGKNICRINDRTVTLATFRQIGQLLINIYGQHDFQAISNKEHHLSLLDALGDNVFVQAKQQMAEAYRALMQIAKQRSALEDAMKERNERLEFLQFKLHELDELHLVSGEFEALEEELAVLDNFEKIASVAEFAHQALYEDRKSVYALLTAVVDRLNTVQQYDKQFAEMASELQNMLYIAEDYGLTLSGYGSKMEFDEEKRDRLNSRKYTLDKAVRKYHMSIDELIAEREKLSAEAAQLQNAEIEIEELNEQYLQKKRAYEAIARNVREMRKALAADLEQKLLHELAQLSMEHTRFAVQFGEKQATAQGMDDVEFYMSANPGQPLRSLSEIASGGEMSRIMLAFKTVLAQNEHIGTLIFDEIDTGIGGNIVVKVAEKLKLVSQYAQVICVTHSPQIAAKADLHLQIQKHTTEDSTITSVQALDAEASIYELARMLGGEEDYQLQHARELKSR
ncbi:MAG: DNA repair protein RecN [Peptococcaceae bacterium]|nr:DNA repair protein RecN [Peptococcaceae bacterium]